MVCTPITAGQVEVLKLARDNRGNLVDVSIPWNVAVASLVASGHFAVDVVGFRLTQAGILLVAQVDERESNAERPRQ